MLPLTPIPVAGPFDRVGVDVIQFTKSHQGNRYAVVFADYLTKRPEVFATPDQSALTIARLLLSMLLVVMVFQGNYYQIEALHSCQSY